LRIIAIISQNRRVLRRSSQALRPIFKTSQNGLRVGRYRP